MSNIKETISNEEIAFCGCGEQAMVGELKCYDCRRIDVWEEEHDKRMEERRDNE